MRGGRTSSMMGTEQRPYTPAERDILRALEVHSKTTRDGRTVQLYRLREVTDG